jgi:circadian clock protein KaiC
LPITTEARAGPIPNLKIQSGIDGLDAMLGGGFPEGKVVLVLGEPGTGKTILCSQYLHWGAVDKNENAVFIGMNEPKARLLMEMRELGIDFADLEKTGRFTYVDATEVRRIPEQAKVGRIPVGGRELGLANLIDLMQESFEKQSPKRIVVDSISDLVFRFPDVEDRRSAVLDIVESLQSTGATCLMTGELLSTGESRKLQPEEYLAEGVIMLRVVRKGARTLQILKMRGSKIDTAPRPFIIKENGIEILSKEEVYS